MTENQECADAGADGECEGLPQGLPGTGDAAKPRVALRAMAADDLGFVVREHIAHFPAGFFAHLGPRYLQEYYRSFLSSPHALTYVAERDGELVGYLAGVIDAVRHRDHVLHQHGRALATAALGALLLHPRLARHFLRTRARRYASKLLRPRPPTPRRREAAEPERPAILSHVAVDAEHQLQGIGSALIRRFESAATRTGCTCMTLVTAAGDGGAGRYYERQGWRSEGEHLTPDGTRLATYVRSAAKPR